jgi:hypothetical protein
MTVGLALAKVALVAAQMAIAETMTADLTPDLMVAAMAAMSADLTA